MEILQIQDLPLTLAMIIVKEKAIMMLREGLLKQVKYL
jgi:hypothetical protein